MHKAGHDVDRRLVLLELSGEGKALMRRLSRIATQFQAQLLAELGPEAAGPFVAGLERLAKPA